MADRIHASTEWLDKCARDLEAVSDAINAAAGTLAGIRLRKDEGGDLRVSMSLSLKMTGGHFSGSNATDDIRQLQRAAAALSGAATSFGAGTRRASQIFQKAENEAKDLIMAMTQGQETVVYNAGGSAGIQLDSTNWILPTMKEIMAILNQWMQERARQRADNARVFDSDGQYGSDQGSPVNDKKRYDLYKDIIEQNTGVRIDSDRDLKKYLSRLNNEGCGYSCIVNAIFRAYEGRSEEFERTFGFPMYRDGDLDYNRLLVDVYSKTDNHNRDGNGNDFFDPNEDYDPNNDASWIKEKLGWSYDPYLDKNGFGTTTDMQDYRTKLYLDSHGVNANVTTYGANEITPANFQTYSSQGEVQVLIGKPFTIHDTSTSTGESSIDGGHWMTITGVENGRFVVSSWGDTYYLDPNDSYGFRFFQVVTIP